MVRVFLDSRLSLSPTFVIGNCGNDIQPGVPPATSHWPLTTNHYPS